MSYALVKNKKLIQYPVVPHNEHPNVSIPLEWKGGIIDDKEYVDIQPTDQITVKWGNKAVEDTPILKKGVWKQTWKIVPLAIEELRGKLFEYLESEYQNKMNEDLLIDDAKLKVTPDLLMYLQGFEYKQWGLGNKIFIETDKEIKEIDFSVINYAVKQFVFNKSLITNHYLNKKIEINKTNTLDELFQLYSNLNWP